MEKNPQKLPFDYISGLTDGEGCFALKFRRDIRREKKGSPVYYYWTVEFAILLHGDDSLLLKSVQKTLNCGKTTLNKRGIVRYAVNRFLDLQGKIIPFFRRHPLHGKKASDFELWAEAVNIIVNASAKKKFKIQKVNFSENELMRLIEIYNITRQFKGKTRIWKWIDKKQGGAT